MHPYTPPLSPQANLSVIHPTSSTLVRFITYTLHRPRLTPSVTVAALYPPRIQTVDASTHHPALRLPNLQPYFPIIFPTPVHPPEHGHRCRRPPSFPISLRR
jgi:hypothetical protein